LGIFYVVEWVIDMLVNPHAGIPHQWQPCSETDVGLQVKCGLFLHYFIQKLKCVDK
jgi:hypothetical protein